MSYKDPWGYLLPLRDGPPPLKLTLDSATMGTSDNCTLQVDGALLGLPADSPPRILFEIHMSESIDRLVGHILQVSMHSKSNVVWINGNQLPGGHEKPLDHGARIAFDVGEATYVFVDRMKSNSSRVPRELLLFYLVGHRLGSGSFGKVYIIFEKESDYKIRRAVKVIDPISAAHLRNAEREARILTSMNHPCVITFFGTFGRLDEQRALIMEYMAGGDLGQFVNDHHHLSEQQTKLVLFQVAMAVKYLHEHDIVHRDLKPSNILLQRRHPHSLIKVTDFGLSKNKDVDSTLDTLTGTRQYLAPEIISDERYTMSVDVWSLGVLLFHSLSGYFPFKNVYEIMNNPPGVTFKHECWRGVSSQARKLVKNMLIVKADVRMTMVQVVDDAWFCDDAIREDAFHLMGVDFNTTRDVKRIPWWTTLRKKLLIFRKNEQ